MAGGWTARNYPKFTQFTDVRGRKSSGYHKHKNLAKEYTTAIVEMEEFMTRWAKEHGVNYGTCNKYMLARQISKEFHRDYMRAIQWFKAGNKKEIDFRDGF